jgi:cation:H+ antiporter
LATKLGVSVLVLSLLLIPVATELPEKVNSLLWAGRGKDTLAVGNLTGALVFQGSLLPALGLWLTPWQPSREVLSAAFVTLIATTWLQIINRSHGVRPVMLLLNVVCYAAYFYLLVVN